MAELPVAIVNFQKIESRRRVLPEVGTPSHYESPMASSDSAPRGRGRPSKGDRFGAHVKLPAEFRAEIEALAERDGLPMGAIITRFVADALGRPAPDYCTPMQKNQEELPLSPRTPVEEPLRRSA